jgi:Family of unknown function (DUF5691)
MKQLVRTAILGTAQVAASPADETGTPADALVAEVNGLDRERAILLRAGVFAIMRRAGRVLAAGRQTLPAAPAETLRRPNEKVAHALESLFVGGETAVLEEALERMARARMRLPEELLPMALSQAMPSLRQRLRPVLGERGVWLSRLRESWAWARGLAASDAELPRDLDERWADGTSQERAALLAAALRLSPDVARKLVAASWKQEKAEQRLEWLEIFEQGPIAADEPWLTAALSDRSGHVRVKAARLLWRLPGSEVARRARERVDALVRARPRVSIEFPPEAFDPAWEKEGIVETPPHGVGRRQWWLAQMIAAVPPTHLAERFALAPAALVDVLLEHELGTPVIDGITTAALRDDARDWFAPLWDAWANIESHAALSEQPLLRLTARLSHEEIEPRALGLLERDARPDLLAAVARPWPARVAQAFLARLGAARPDWIPLLPVAALALPVELVPDLFAIPESSGDDAAHHVFLRAFDSFQSTLAARRDLAKEIAS